MKEESSAGLRGFRFLGLNLPNCLTAARIALVPVILGLLAWNGPHANLWAAAVFALASWTDNLDGLLARKWGQITDMGRFLDPMADKLLVDVLLVWFTAAGAVSVWLVILVIAREFLVSGVRLVAAGRGVVISADFWGKLKAVSQMALVFLLLTGWRPGILVMAWAAALLTAGSGVEFFVKNGKILVEI